MLTKHRIDWKQRERTVSIQFQVKTHWGDPRCAFLCVSLSLSLQYLAFFHGSPSSAQSLARRLRRRSRQECCGLQGLLLEFHFKTLASQTVHVQLYVTSRQVELNIFQKSSKYDLMWIYEVQWSVRSMQELNHNMSSRQEFQSCYSQSINDECIKAHVHHNSTNHYYTCAVAFPFAATKLIDRRADLEETSKYHLW